MRKFVLLVFVFVAGFLSGSELSKYLYSETHFEANILDHYIYKNNNFENLKSSKIFENSDKNWIEICDKSHPETDISELKLTEVSSDNFLSEYLYTLLLRNESEIAILKFDTRKYKFKSDLSCAKLDKVSVSVRKSKDRHGKFIVTLKEVR